jgi:hypothetical protein
MKTSSVTGLWKRIAPEWRFAFSAFLVFRMFYLIWPLIILRIFPLAVQNGDLFGQQFVSVFDMHTSRASVFSPLVDGDRLQFISLGGSLVDRQTGSIWDAQNGTAISGALAGKTVPPSTFTAEDVFPYHDVPPATTGPFAVWQRFDVNWYMKIARDGYGNDGSVAYFPLFPLLMRLLGPVTGGDFWAGILISNLSLIAVLYLLQRIAAFLVDGESARRSVVYFLFFPTSFFLLSVYTESLFLVCVLASLVCALRSRWGWAILFGALSAATRLQGVLMVLPLGLILWRELRHAAQDKPSEALFSTSALFRFVSMFVIPLTTLGFFLYTRGSFFHAYQDKLYAKFTLPWNNLWASISLLAGGSGGPIDALNLIITVLLCGMLVLVWRKLPLELTVYSLLMFIAPMFRMTTTQPLVSMSRYALVVFPIFIVFGSAGRNPWVNRAVLYLSLPLQMYLSAQYFLWGWVA